MWGFKIRGQLKKIQSAYDEFVKDFLDYSDKIHGKLDPELSWLVNQAPDKLGILIHNTEKVKEYLLEFSKIDDLSWVKATYSQAIVNYKAMIDEGYVVIIPCQSCPKGRLCSDKVCSRKLVKEAFVYFYSLIGTQAFIKSYLPHLSTRGTDSKKIYREESSKLSRICPYCDRNSINHHSDRSTDHYLPSKKIPLLSIHSMNLVVACSSCNERLKGEKIELPSYHPYFHQIANQFTFEFQFSTFKENPDVNISIQGDHVKMNNYLKVFDLQDVYSSESWRIANKLEEFSREVKRNYQQTMHIRRLSGTRIPNHVDSSILKRVAKRHLINKLKENAAKQAEEDFIKFTRDFYLYLYRDFDQIVRYISTNI